MRAILTYHSLDASRSPISIAPEVFREQMQWLAREGPTVVGLAELLRAPVARDAVALTFDDAFENFAAHAAPVLREFGLPATVFVVSDRVGTDNVWSDPAPRGIPILPLMDWDRIGRLAEQGFEMGAHSRTHPSLPSVSKARLEDELGGCAEVIEARLGVRPLSFAYPFGAFDDDVVAVAARTFEQAVTTELRLVASADRPHTLPRLDMFYFRAPGQFEAWGTPRFRRRLAWRASLRRLRSAVKGGA